MKNELILVQPHCEEKQKTKRLEQVLQKALENICYQKITKEEEFKNLQNKKGNRPPIQYNITTSYFRR